MSETRESDQSTIDNKIMNIQKRIWSNGRFSRRAYGDYKSVVEHYRSLGYNVSPHYKLLAVYERIIGGKIT